MRKKIEQLQGEEIFFLFILENLMVFILAIGIYLTSTTNWYSRERVFALKFQIREKSSRIK